MAEAGSYSEARTGNWLWALLVGAILLVMELILFAALVPATWSERVRNTELAWLNNGLGPTTANAIIERADYWYGALFVKPGLVETSYRITLPSDVERAGALSSLATLPLWTWVASRLEVIWAALYQALQRLAMLAAWWPFLLLLLAAAWGDGWVRRRIRQAEGQGQGQILCRAPGANLQLRGQTQLSGRCEMRRPERPFGKHDSAGEQALYMAMELSSRQWKLGFTDRRHRVRQVTVEARDLLALQEQIGKAKGRFGLPADAPVLCCYEAGRDGFWLHRYLVSCGIVNQVLEPSSIKVDRRRRRAKTDRLDVDRMLMQLLRYLDGDTEELHVVRVPTQEQEDGRRLHREQLRLQEERKAHRTRINALLVTQGIELKVRSDFRTRLEQLTCWDASPLRSAFLAPVQDLLATARTGSAAGREFKQTRGSKKVQ